MATTFTAARGNVDFFLHDIDTLIRTHDESTGKKQGRPKRELEVLKRSALILLVTAWETFIEDTLKSEFETRLAISKSPSAIQGTFNAVAQAWLEEDHKNPPDLQEWAGDGWRNMIAAKFDSDIESLNTPNADNVRKLFKRYLGSDVTQDWKWPGKSAKSACSDLNAAIKLRGDLVHRGQELFSKKSKVRMAHVKNARNLIERLVQSTEAALGIPPVTL